MKHHVKYDNAIMNTATVDVGNSEVMYWFKALSC
jgi:hypothetical protein